MSAPSPGTVPGTPVTEAIRLRVLGPLLTLALVVVFEAAGRPWHVVPGPLFLAAIAISALVGGLRSGLASAALSLAYLAHFFSAPGALLHFSPENLRRFLILLLLCPALALLVGLLKHRADRLARDAVLREREQAEARRVSEERYRSLVEHASDGIVAVDTAGRIVAANPAIERISGWTVEDVLGRDFRELGIIAEESLALAAERFPRTLAGQTGPPYEITIVTKHGGRVVVEVNSSPVTREGKVVGGQVMLRDVTERRRTEQAERQAEALRSVTLLAAAASHEINNPLSIVVGRTQMLMERVGEDSPLRPGLQQVLSAAGRIQDIVARMAEITRIETAAEHEGLPPILDIRRSAGEPETARPGGPAGWTRNPASAGPV